MVQNPFKLRINIHQYHLFNAKHQIVYVAGEHKSNRLILKSIFEFIIIFSIFNFVASIKF